jgi:2-polyprenyl-6-methoxyphenol hydroxylase-like FAD-dependent oxidoreductase
VKAGPEVLVVGAGPTGLALALQAHDHGARVRIVERRPEAFRPSRALLVHPRTLEVLRPLGVTEELLARADASPSAQLHLGRHVVPVHIADVGAPGTAFSHLILLRQLDVEAVLAAALDARGVPVERGTELVELGEDSGGPWALLASSGGTQRVRPRMIAGCDGVASAVRRLAGIGWRGGDYAREIVLADVEMSGDVAPGVAHVAVGRRGLLFIFPLGEGMAWRLLATRPVGAGSLPPGQFGSPVPRDELQRLLVDAGLDAEIDQLGWSSRVRLQHRVADRYRHGGVFLAGDAAHASSPAGGQGMNTGIQDAVNLGWKLAYAPASSDPQALLDSYDEERRPVAHRTLALTRLLFWAESATDPLAVLLRTRLAPLGAPLLPLVLRDRPPATWGVQILSQLKVGYRGSRLSVNGVPPRRGLPRAGDRVADRLVHCGAEAVQLHDLLAGPGLHLLLDRAAPDPEMTGRQLRAYRLADSPGVGVLAVRPDGHVGFAGSRADDPRLKDWLARVGALPGARARADAGESVVD